MKQLYLYLFLLITITTSSIGNSQVTLSPVWTVEHEHIWNAIPPFPPKMIKDSLGGLYYCGRGTNIISQSFFVKIDENGERLWSLTFGENETTSYRLEYAEASPDGHLLAAFRATDPFTLEGHFYLQKLTINGELIWQNDLGAVDIFTHQIVTDEHSDTYLVSKSMAENYTRVYKINSDGDLIWTTSLAYIDFIKVVEYEEEVAFFSRYEMVHLDKEAGAILDVIEMDLPYIYSDLPYFATDDEGGILIGSYYYYRFMKLNWEGEMEWEYIRPSEMPDGTGGVLSRTAYVTHKTSIGFVVAGLVKNPDYGSQMIITRFNKMGDMLFESKFDYRDGEIFSDYALNVLIYEDKIIAVGGSKDGDEAGTGQIGLYGVQLNMEGEEIAEFFYQGSEEEFEDAKSCQVGSDGALYVLGAVNNTDRLFLQKYDLATTTKEIAPAASDWEVYPNPAQEWLEITTKIEVNAAVGFELYNTHGQLLMNETSHVLPARIDISALPAGVYFLLIESDGRYWRERVIRH